MSGGPKRKSSLSLNYEFGVAVTSSDHTSLRIWPGPHRQRWIA